MLTPSKTSSEQNLGEELAPSRRGHSEEEDLHLRAGQQDKKGSAKRLSTASYALAKETQDPIESGIDILRWGSIALSVLVIGLRSDSTTSTAWVTTIILVFYASFRTWQPIRFFEQLRSKPHAGSLSAEIGLHIAAAAVTGLWTSALIYPLIASVAITGLIAGRNLALLGAVSASTIITLLSVIIPLSDQEITQRSLANTATLILAAIVAGHGYRILAGDNEFLQSSHLRQLTAANRLLADLHHVSQTLPASLNRQEVLQTSISRLRTILEFDSAAIFIIDPQDNQWEAAHKVGMPIEQNIDMSDIPALATLAANEHRLIRTTEHTPEIGHFLDSSRSSMFAPLLARETLIGLLAVESSQPSAFSRENEETLEGFVVSLGLTIDNAQWFSRIRSASLNEERNRIARNLHDNLGQSLAHLGFELDRVMLNNSEGTDISEDLIDLRKQIKHVVGQQREALHDLRSDVNEQKDLAQTIEEFAGRLSERQQLAINVYSDTKARLPILQEREMWRITQEALINVGRHADATEVNVYWSCSKTEAFLEVIDNGRGLLSENVDQVGSYGILGMRERATSIGAIFELTSKPNQGTKVRCYLNRN